MTVLGVELWTRRSELLIETVGDGRATIFVD